MDPQKLSQLDPKLREAYLRVMGTEVPTPQATPSVQTPAAVPQFQAQESSRPFVPTAQTIPGFGQGSSEIPVPQTSMPTGLRMTSPTGPAPAFRPQPVALKSGFMPVLFAIVGVVFIVIYALFWTRVFNLKLPFLP
jgi:hypothetical protein